MSKERSSYLPEHGILTDDGHYFHHTFAKPLIREEKQALINHGIEQSSKCFTEAEDNMIRDNWKRFADKNNIALEHARVASLYKLRVKHKELFEKVNFHDFWPTMCTGFPHRSAYQILKRLYYINDPAILSGMDKILYSANSKELMLTHSQLDEVDRMLAEGQTWPTISEKIGKSSNRCMREHRRWLLTNQQISRKLWSNLWAFVETPGDVAADDLDENSVLTMIRRYCLFKDSALLEEIVASMDISGQALKLEKTKKAVKNTWKIILESLEKCFRHSKKQSSYLSDDILFIRAVNEKIKFAFMVNFEQFTAFLNVLIDATPVDEVYSRFTVKQYSIASMETRMKRRGITGFYCGNEGEFLYLFHTVSFILYRCQNRVFSLLCKKYSVKDRLTILLQTLELQWEHLHKNADRNEAKRLDMSSYREQSRITHMNYMYVKTNFFLDVLVTFTVQKDPKWIPPTKFLSYMIRPETIALFPKKTDNSALVETTRSKRDNE